MVRESTAAERAWRLERNYQVLAHQKAVLETLQLAMQLSYGQAEWYSEADTLLRIAAREVFRTCRQIVDDSGVEPLREGE